MTEKLCLYCESWNFRTDSDFCCEVCEDSWELDRHQDLPPSGGAGNATKGRGQQVDDERERTMCESTFDGNKVEVCTAGDLKPGQQFRTPNGDTILVTDGSGTLEEVATVNVRTGRLATERADTRLGTDRRGRLYASRYLNRTPRSDATVQDEQVDVSQPPQAPPNHTTMGDI